VVPVTVGGSLHPRRRIPARAGGAARGGYVSETDAEVAREEPGTRNGGGTATGYSFFRNVPSPGREDLVILINYEAAPK
jgi:hypothetical protein